MQLDCVCWGKIRSTKKARHRAPGRTGMNRRRKIGGGLCLVALSALAADAAQAQQAPIKLGIVSFLTGAAAGPFGIPGRNGAEIVLEGLNAGPLPAPYNTVGLGGAKIEAKYVDEAGSAANVVTE